MTLKVSVAIAFFFFNFYFTDGQGARFQLEIFLTVLLKNKSHFVSDDGRPEDA